MRKKYLSKQVLPSMGGAVGGFLFLLLFPLCLAAKGYELIPDPAMRRGVKLLLADVQRPFVHVSDEIFARDKRLDYRAVDENAATVISCAESRAVLKTLGVDGEILRTPSHSEDSVSLLLDDGSCLVGDLEPLAYLAGYDENAALKSDWEQILCRHPKRILYAHANEQRL